MVETSRVEPEDVLRFWFGEPGERPLAKAELWWAKSEAFDAEIRERFLETLERGLRGELATWRATPRGRLALVILLDQFSRNMFRGTPRSFAQDALAREVATEASSAGDERVLTPVEASFLLMPLMHAEDIDAQRRCVEGFTKLRDTSTDEALRAYFDNSVKFAVMHLAIIERFGHFSHRNAILGRPSTDEEVAFLKQPGSSF